jgi:hypothetical protein
MPMGPGYDYAEEVHPTASARGNAGNCRAAARGAEDGAEDGAASGVAGAGMGGGNGTVGLLSAYSVRGNGIAGAGGSVVLFFVKRLRPALSPSSRSVEGQSTEVRQSMLGCPVGSRCWRTAHLGA